MYKKKIFTNKIKKLRIKWILQKNFSIREIKKPRQIKVNKKLNECHIEILFNIVSNTHKTEEWKFNYSVVICVNAMSKFRVKLSVCNMNIFDKHTETQRVYTWKKKIKKKWVKNEEKPKTYLLFFFVLRRTRSIVSWKSFNLQYTNAVSCKQYFKYKLISN